ncbi:hypothetical protein J2S45_001885 [Trueperella abortisuis]|uniref:Uncharacterized protein n=1 Tax=Trueperella abortisuis TaxID=445930 RepID=A0ABT9PL60_9ACTO|nr:hypothetical protein [Trueperella abortisuis]
MPRGSFHGLRAGLSAFRSELLAFLAAGVANW